MTNFENLNQPESFHVPEAEVTLESGLAALKQRNYRVAIAQLKQVAKTSKQTSIRLKAQMGLINAYEQAEQPQKALLGCQRLQSSKSSNVRHWAEQKLASLYDRYPHLQDGPELDRSEPDGTQSNRTESNRSDVVSSNPDLPSQPPPSSSRSSDRSTPPSRNHLDHDSTGFQPFDGNEPPPPIAPKALDATGFVPFSSDAEAPHGGEPTVEHEADRPDASPHLTSPSAAPLPSSPSESEFENPFASLDDLAAGAGDRPTETPTLPDAPAQSSAPEETESSTQTAATTASQGAARTPPPVLPSERARHWKPLKSSTAAEFWLSCAWTAIALLLVLSLILRIALATAEPLWWRLERWGAMPRIAALENHPMWFVAGGLLLLLLLSPWLTQWILGQFYGVKPLSERELERRSPETLRLLKRVCQQNRMPKPQLHLMASDAPFLFSYGHLPRTAHIVTSRGLLTQLSDDELACLYGSELGHILQRDVIPMTLSVLVQQIPFLLYWTMAQWGDRQRQTGLRALAKGITAVAYGLFWLLRLPGLWLSRARQPLGDRYAASLTGNPNGHTRALLNVSVGMAQAIERQRLTEPVLEGFESLMPVSYRQALTLGSLHTKQQALYQRPASSDSSDSTQQTSASSETSLQLPPTVTLQPFLVWDVKNSYRRWLTLNSTHPPLGDRLAQLAHYALQWRIRPDLDIAARSARSTSKASESKPFWLQVLPFVAPLLGVAAAVVLWLAGGVARTANVDAIEWLWGDRSLLWGCVAIGFSFGTLIRINSFFPDITSSEALPETALPELLTAAHLIPVDSIPVKWTGKLLGRTPICNGLDQDLILRTAHGSIKLHYLSHIGPLGNLILGKVHPSDLIGQTVTITGWFRRGANPWIDVETLKPERHSGIRGGHPLWSTLLAVVATLWGAYVIYNGSF